MHLSAQAGLGDGLQHGGLVGLLQGHLDGVQNLQRLVLGHLEALGNDPGVEALGDVDVGLLEELADEEHGGGGAVARDVVLGRRRPGGGGQGGDVVVMSHVVVAIWW